MKVFQRLIVSFIAIIFGLMSLIPFAAGEQYEWVCPECDRAGNTGNYCGKCGHPAPWLDTGIPSPVPDSRMQEFKMTGNTVMFGHYEQDNDVSNGTEPIEWIVLDYDEANHRSLLISKYGLDTKKYDNSSASNTWDKCTLRTWLNGEFQEEAFSVKEQSAILVTEVDNSDAQGFDWTEAGEDKATGGENTWDWIFLLSYAEANRYLGVSYEKTSNVKSRVAPTAYATEMGASISDVRNHLTVDGDLAGWWWLRSPGFSRKGAYVNSVGSFQSDQDEYSGVLVRPAFWLSLEPDTETPAATSAPRPGDADAKISRLQEFEITGNTVTFGYYEQDNDKTNGPESIEWIVLDYDEANRRALLISKYGLDVVPYNKDFTAVNWKECTMRDWLNGEFLNEAFSAKEQSAIQITMLDNNTEQDNSEGGENSTQDRIFLLCYDEVHKYFGVQKYSVPGSDQNQDARITLTAYAKTRGAWTSNRYLTADGKPTAWWWLRLPGDRQNIAGRVDYGGSYRRSSADDDSGVVRPAFWLYLESDILLTGNQ